MIKATNIKKSFGKTEALSGISCEIPNGCVYGLVGSNGAGKSTLLRIMAGVYRPDSGEVTVDGKPVWEDPDVKRKVVLVADEPYFPPSVSMKKMADLTAALDEQFDRKRFDELSELLKLDKRAPVATFSKGMRRQAAMVLALSRRPDYLLLDEAFDGLDPVMRRLMRGLITDEILDRGMSTVIASHSLRELEDTCDSLALLHKGSLILESDIGTLKTSLFKMQVAFREDFDRSKFSDLNILSFKKTGSVAQIILKGDGAAAAASVRKMNPLLLDILPLTLEEVFDYEMEALGYHFEAKEGELS